MHTAISNKKSNGRAIRNGEGIHTHKENNQKVVLRRVTRARYRVG